MIWQSVTRLGELPVLLPAVLLAVLAMLRGRATRTMATTWLALVAAAMALTLASKLAFLGWGVGSVRLDFTGVSGHAMLAAALLPVLLLALVPVHMVLARRWAVGVGAVLALLVGASRIALGAHSGSEVMAGWVLGGAAAALALRGASRGNRRSPVGTQENLGAARRRVEPDTIPASGRQQRSGAMSVAALLALGLWLSLGPAYAPRVDTHGLVTQLSLQLSGRTTPWSRADMLRERRRDKTLLAPDRSTRQRLQQASS